MRTALFLILTIGIGAVARAQQQDPGLLLQTRNEGIASALFQHKSFYDGQTFQGTHSANVRSLYLPEQFDTREFAVKNYRAPSFWQGDFHFATKEALTKKDARDERTFETKSAAVKDARESGKNYETREYANTHAFEARGKAQKALDEQSAKKKMSIDEVRELLNKNK